MGATIPGDERSALELVLLDVILDDVAACCILILIRLRADPAVPVAAAPADDVVEDATDTAPGDAKYAGN